MADPARKADVATSADPAELEKFGALAAEWWDPEGKFRPLHKFNPVRLGYIRDQAVAHFGRNTASTEPLAGLNLLDIGCGGGLLCEPMARLGAQVTGIDAEARNIEVARTHAQSSGLDIDYRAVLAEELVAAGAQFDIVLTMEVVEHVTDVDAFLADCAALLRPGGLMIFATLNRTAKAYALAIVGAEYILGWLPRGTHDWRKFVRPSELARGLRKGGGEVTDLTGVVYSPVTGEWSLHPRDLDVNYMGTAERGA